MPLEIRPVRSKRDLKEFLHLPWAIYKGDPNWVPPILAEVRKLLAKTHPIHAHVDTELWVARREGRPVGRISACHNRAHLETHNDGAGFWGFFECTDDKEVAALLFDTADAWLRERGLKISRGPCSFSTNEECGLLVEGFHEPPTFMMSYNPKRYIDLVEGCGFTKAKDLWAWFVDKPAFKPPEKLFRVVNRIREREGLTIRGVDMKRIPEELEFVRKIYNEAWSKNWGFVPMSPAEFDVVAADFKKIVQPELLLFAELKGKPAGFSLSLPDYNVPIRKMNGGIFPFGWLQWLLNVKKIKRIRYITMGIMPEFQKRGIDAIFYFETMDRGLKLGYTEVEMSWILEDNTVMNSIIESFGTKKHKVYRLYDRPL